MSILFAGVNATTPVVETGLAEAENLLNITYENSSPIIHDEILTDQKTSEEINGTYCANCSSNMRVDRPEDAPPASSLVNPLSVSSSSSSSSPGLTFKTDTGYDLDQYLCGPGNQISFPINVILNGETVKTARLELKVFDVDRLGGSGCQPEIDQVYFNGVNIGELSGADSQWSIPSFKVDPNLVQEGENWIAISIDSLGTDCWCVECDYGVLSINSEVPTIEKIFFSPSIPVTSKSIGLYAIIKKVEGYKITSVKWKFYDKSGSQYSLVDTQEGRISIFDNTGCTYVGIPTFSFGNHGVKVAECLLFGKKIDETESREFDSKKIEYKVFFEMGSIMNGWAKPFKSKIPNWFIFWQKDRDNAIPSMSGFKYELSGEWAGLCEPNGKVKLSQWAPYVDILPTKIRIGPTRLMNGEEVFGNCNSEIQATTQTVSHELGHQACRYEFNNWPLESDSDKDHLPDVFENGSYHKLKIEPRGSLTLTDNVDTYGINLGKGDDEYVAYRAGERGKNNFFNENDWSDIGQMALEQKSVYNTNVVSPHDSSIDSSSEFLIELISKPISTKGNLISNFTECGIDTDGNRLYNSLDISFTLNINENNHYAISGFLNKTNDNTIDQYFYLKNLTAGCYNVTLPFDGVSIYHSKESGPYNLSLILSEVQGYEQFINLGTFSNIYTTNPYSLSQFEGAQVGLGNSYSDKPIDSDGDGVYNSLNVNTSLNVVQPGTYRLAANLFKDTNLITSTSVESQYTIGSQTVPLMFDGSVIGLKGIDGPYQVKNLTLQDNEDVILDYNESPYTTGMYTAESFRTKGLTFQGSFSDQGLDVDGSGKYDILRIFVPVQVTQQDNYLISGSLCDVNGENIDTVTNRTDLQVGPQIIPLDFNGRLIGGHGVNGPFNLTMLQADNSKGKSVDYKGNAYTTQSYSVSQFDVDSIYLTGDYSSQGIDTDNNGLYNYLDIAIGVNVTTAGQYESNCALIGANGEQIDWASNSTYLTPGKSTDLVYRFDGRKIYGTRTDGRLGVEGFLIYNPSVPSASLSKSHAYTTDLYQYTEFESCAFISGNVKTQYGTSVKGVSIFIPGVALNTSGNNGEYLLSVPSSGSFTVTAQPSQSYLMSNSTSINTMVGQTTIHNPILNSAISAPLVSSIEPNFGNPGKIVNVTKILGSNFVTGADMYLLHGVSGINATKINFTSSSELNGTITIPPSAELGTWDVIVVNPDGQSGNLIGGFTIQKETVPVPVITGLNPGSVLNYSQSVPFPVIISGTGFNTVVGTDNVTVDGIGVPYIVESASQINATFPATIDDTLGNHSVLVRGEGGPSSAHNFIVSANGFMINATTNGIGWIDPSDTLYVDPGTPVHFSFKPSAGALVKNLTVNGYEVTPKPESNYTISSVDQNYDVRLNCEPLPGVIIAAFKTDSVGGNSVRFTDASWGNPNTWKWDFGDGSSSNDNPAEHTYQKSGMYKVSLWSRNNMTQSQVVMGDITIPMDSEQGSSLFFGP